jgi:hypothetical protein
MRVVLPLVNERMRISGDESTRFDLETSAWPDSVFDPFMIFNEPNRSAEHL